MSAPGEALKMLRELQGLSQNELPKKQVFHNPTFQHWKMNLSRWVETLRYY